MRVTVSQACEGTGYCLQLLPEVFALTADGKSSADPAAAAQASAEDLLEAERMCPTTAIAVQPDEG
jgi:ferredoxin